MGKKLRMASLLAILLLVAAGCANKADKTAAVASNATAKAPAVANSGAVIKVEDIFETAPFKSCHASTIAQTPGGFVAAWFGGTAEGNRDVTIWLSHNREGIWSAPLEVASGQMEDGSKFPCWNPVLFQAPNGPLILFYKVGPNPRQWWGMRMSSTDGGKSWSKPTRLPAGILGPIKNKPVMLSDGTLLCGSSTEDNGWRVHMEISKDLAQTWTKSEPPDGGRAFGVIQPTILSYPGGATQILCRSSRKQRIVESWSADGGRTWIAMAATDLPNPDSGIDAVMLKDGRALLVYNHSTTDRTPLNIATSTDGKTWAPGPVLENTPGGYAYPAVIQSSDGLVHITYTWKRLRIRHVIVDPSRLPS